MTEVDVVPVIGYSRQAVTLEILLLTELTWMEKRLDCVCVCDCDVVEMTTRQNTKSKKWRKIRHDNKT